ncbi:MAG TPA: hypothetical protein VGH79_04710 [Gaiellaceae bacterium]|jgi:hypothetical protein
MPLRATLVLAIALLAGCGGGSTTPSAQKGRLHGTVMRGPTSPVCRPTSPCLEAASGARLVFKAYGGGTTSVVVAKDGSYSASLAPATYAVSVAQQPPVGRAIDPRLVEVTAGERGRVDFVIDTGIR